MRRGAADVVSFQDPLPEPTADRPRPERLVRGNPERRTWNLYTDPSDTVYAGIWACEPGAWRIECPAGQDEFCHLLEGRMRLSDGSGDAREFQAGDSFVLPGGFEGIWETLEPLRKHYVIVTRP